MAETAADLNVQSDLRGTREATCDSTQSGHSSRPVDNVIIHPHVLDPSHKRSTSQHFKKQLVDNNLLIGKSPAKAFAAQLQQAHIALQCATESTTTAEASVKAGLKEYLGLLVGLLNCEKGGSEQSDVRIPQQLLGNSPLRKSIRFSWQDVLVTTASCTYPDAAFELASVLISTSLWLMRRSASLCRDSASGVSTAASMQAFKLLQEAAGILDFAHATVLPLLPAGISSDCSPEVVRGVSLLCLADCQMLTVLRAVQKGNQPSLIASLARDTADLYGLALHSVCISTAVGAAESKLANYLRYQHSSLLAYAYCFAGITQWKSGQAGAALRILQEAQAAVDAAKKTYPAYDQAQPATLTMAHRRYDEILQAVLDDTWRRVQKENEVVFLQRVPTESSELPATKRIVAATPFSLPGMVPAARDAVQGLTLACGVEEQQITPVHGASSTYHTSTGQLVSATQPAQTLDQEPVLYSCWRWSLFLFAFPLMILVSVVGGVVWVLLLPIKLLCCPCGCLRNDIGCL